jgi:hypothetical protein
MVSRIVISGVAVLIGLSIAVFAERIAQLNERLDAIGSKREWSEVEPAGWNTAIVRVVGIGIALYGLWISVAGYV